MTSAAAPATMPDTRVPFHLRGLFAIAAVVAAADFLLLGHRPGVSLTILLALLAGAVVVVHAATLKARDVVLACAVLVVALAPSVEHFGVTATIFGVLGTALFARIAVGRLRWEWSADAVATIWIAIAGPIQSILDLTWLQSEMRAAGPMRVRLEKLLAWCLPIALGLVFVLLFRTANPIIEQWISRLDLTRVLTSIDAHRIGFWVWIAAAAWSFVFVGRFEPHRVERSNDTKTAAPGAAPRKRESALLGPAAILRSLIVFNVLFAVQTGMDAAYLWASAELPEGFTYASYAHRGAYTLLAATLLAAVFMLATMRPGGALERAPLIRALAFLWAAQNVVLVISSMRRLELYVEVYSLTHLRVAALIWMLLVAVGLLLIVARIAFRRSGGWLIVTNATSLAVTLYACAFVNFADVIARYNIAHSYEITGRGLRLDTGYLCELGPQALTAIEEFLLEAAARGPDPRLRPVMSNIRTLARCADGMRARHERLHKDWRSWSIRGWRLSRSLRDTPDAAL